MSPSKPLLGLHVQLIAAGPTMRFAVWFERAATAPRAFREARHDANDVPFPHPEALPHADAPAWISRACEPATLLVTLPRLANYHPVALPGLASAWDVSEGIGPRARASLRGPYRVPAWIVPADRSLRPLRALLASWLARHGAELASPHAPALVDALDALDATLTAGPLLPTLAPPAEAWREALRAPLAGDDPSARLGWTPPVSLAALCALDASLRDADLLAAALDYDFHWRVAPRVHTWAAEALPRRLAAFLVEVFTAAVAPPEAPAGLRAAVARGDARALHTSRGSCLHPHHPALAADARPTAHLHGRLVPDGDAWTLALGLAAPDGGFLPLADLAARDALRHAAVARDGRAWVLPAATLARDWSAAAATHPALRTPALLRDGRATLTAREAQSLRDARPLRGDAWEHQRWLESHGLAGAAEAYTAFSASAAGSP